MDISQNEQLSNLIEEAKGRRLSPAREDQAVSLIKELILKGRVGIQQGLEAAVQLSWSIGVKALSETWPDLKESARRLIVTSLNHHKNEQGRRIRMSVARGLFPIDPPVTLKMLASVCDELLNAPPETITNKDRQSFSNVFIGKGKPWLHHLELTGLRPGEATKIIQCAVAACFPREVSPFTQICLLRWIQGTGRLGKLPDETVGVIVQGVQRWPSKFRRELARDIPGVPDPIREILAVQGEETDHESTSAAPEDSNIPETPAVTPDAEPPAELEPAQRRTSASSAKGRNRNKTDGSAAVGKGAVDITRSLQEIQRYVSGLENELGETREKLRRITEGTKRARRTVRNEESVCVEELQKELESLKRYNSQLEDRAEELKHRLTEFAADHEEIAFGLRAGSEDPITDAKEQYRVMLGVKLRQDFEEFQAVEREPEDEVFREHYRILLKSVFQTLEECGVDLHHAGSAIAQ
jgi:hypothetical protein